MSDNPDATPPPGGPTPPPGGPTPPPGGPTPPSGGPTPPPGGPVTPPPPAPDPTAAPAGSDPQAAPQAPGYPPPGYEAPPGYPPPGAGYGAPGGPPPGTPPYGTPGYGYATTSPSDERTWVLLAHFGAVVLGLFAPLIVMLVKSDSPLVRAHAVESLNFQLTWFVVLLVLSVLTCGIGAIGFLFPVIMAIIAGVKAANGEPFRYPLTVRLIK